MFNRIALAAAIIFWGCISFGMVGCNKSRRTVVSTAPVTTYSVVYVDTFTDRERQELNDSIAAIISALKDEKPSVTYNFTFNITKTHVTIKPRHDNILAGCGDDNECPGLFSRLCERLGDDSPRHKEKDRELCEENKRRNRRGR